MGLQGLSRQSGGTPITVQPTFLENVTGSLFRAIDAPGNIARAGVLAAEEAAKGEYSSAGNAILEGLKTAVPFISARRIEPSEITGSDDFWLNLGVEFVLDPMLLVSGIGASTKAGKALKLATNAATELRVAKKLGTAAEIAKATEVFAERAKKYREIAKVVGKDAPKTSILKLAGGFEIGDANKLASLNLFPPLRTIELQKRQLQAQRKLKLADTPGKVTRARTRLSEINLALEKADRGLIPFDKDFKLRGQLKNIASGIRARFGHKAASDFIDTAAEHTRSDIASLRKVIGDDAASAVVELENLAKLRNVEKVAQAERLLDIAEKRHLLKGDPKWDEVFRGRADDLQGKLRKKLRRSDDPLKTAEAWDQYKVDMIKLNKEIDAARIEGINFLDGVKAGDYTAGELQFVEKYVDGIQTLVDIERANGINIKQLQAEKDGMLSYMRRLPSAKAKALRKANPSLFNLITSEFAVRLPSAHERILYPEKTVLQANRLIRKDYGIDFDFFDGDAVKSLLDRRLQSVQAVEHARFVNAMVESYAQPLKANRQSVKVEKFLTTMGLDATNPRYEKLKELRISKEYADQIKGTSSVLKNSIFGDKPELRAAFKIIEKINNVFKAGLTTLFPGFNHKNAISDIFLNQIGGVSPLRHADEYAKAAALRYKMAKGTASADELKYWEELVRYNMVDKGQLAELNNVFKSKLANEVLDRPLSKVPVAKQISEFVGGKTAHGFDPLTGKAYGTFLSDIARMTHYAVKRKAGATPLEAMRSVNKVLFDYTKLTPFERQVMKPTILFYSWLRNNIPLMINTTLHDPRLVSIYENLTGINQDDVPTYLRGNRAFRYGEKEVIGSIGLPFEDLNLFNIADADPNFFDQLSRISDRIVSKLSPALRIPLELAQGRTSFSHKQIADMSTGEMVKEFTPLSRTVRTGEKLFDPERTNTFKAIDFLTGIRTYPVDKSRIDIDKLKREALSTGKFKRSGPLILTKKQYEEEPETKKYKKDLDKKLRALMKQGSK